MMKGMVVVDMGTLGIIGIKRFVLDLVWDRKC